MRRKTVGICLVLFMLTLVLHAQEENSSKPVFHSLGQVALVNGNHTVSGALQVVNGFSLGNWYAGIGAGIDFYRYRSIPLFLDVRRSFNIKKGNQLFIYTDGGYNVPWVTRNEPLFSIWSWPTTTDYTYNGGIYLGAGLGYALQVKGGHAFLLSTGFSHKYFTERRTTFFGRTTESERAEIQNLSYSLNRLMIKLGWQF